MGAIYLLIAAGAVLFVWLSPPGKSVFEFLVVCAFDGFSQVAGQIFGRRQLAPRISPGKTIEGSLGGLFAAAAMAMLLRPIVGWNGLRSLLACCFIVAAALTGDLLASLVKRRSNIKDFSNLLRGTEASSIALTAFCLPQRLGFSLLRSHNGAASYKTRCRETGTPTRPR